MNSQEIEVAELSSFCDNLSRDLMKDHEKRFADRIRSVREAASGLGNAASRLATGVKNAWGTLDKQTSEYAMRLAQTLQENAQSLSKVEPASDFHSTETFHQDTVKVLNGIILTVRKYVPKIPKTLRLEMTILNSSLTRLEKCVRELGKALDDSPGLKLESLRRDVETLVQKHPELAELKSEAQKEGASLEETFNREKRLTSEDDSIISTPEFLELHRYEDALKLKEDEIRQFLQPISKPLLKLETARAAKKGEALDIKTLHDLVERPIETVVAGQLFAMNQLLAGLGNALRNGELGLEDRKRRKAEDVIEGVGNNALEKLRAEYLALQANTQESLRQLKSKGLLDKRNVLKEQLAQTRSEIEKIRDRQKELQRRRDDLSKSISKLKTGIEPRISKLAHQSVAIAFD